MIPWSPRHSFRAGYHLPEIVFARGPAAEAVTGAGDYQALLGTIWALEWNTQRGLVLRKDVSGSWEDAAPLVALPLLPDNAAHIAFCFDQAARPVIAWETAGQMYVRQWDVLAGEFVIRGPFAGVDPVLLNDAVISADLAAADVFLWYLSADRRSVKYRLQSGNYATENALADANAAPVAFTQDAYLDQIVDINWRYQLALTVGGAKTYLVSLYYPIRPSEALTGTGAMTTGKHDRTTAVYSASEALTGTGAMTTGKHDRTTAVYSASEALTGTGAMTTGKHDRTTAVYSASEALTGTGAMTTGRYQRV